MDTYLQYAYKPIFTLNFCVCMQPILAENELFYLKEHVKTLFINLCFVGKLTYNCFSTLISD